MVPLAAREVTEGPVELVVGILPNGAGVDDDDVRVAIGGADVPAASSDPLSRSESWTFIWQPNVRTS